VSPGVQRSGNGYVRGPHTLSKKEVKELTSLAIEELGGPERLVQRGEEIRRKKQQELKRRQAQVKSCFDIFRENVLKHFEEEVPLSKDVFTDMDGIIKVMDELHASGIDFELVNGELILSAKIVVPLI